ncbi:co-chaperone GroES [Fimbriiglobus ruber]|uniref:Co-chaperonin GroES n=1 Tax=Fimbriiglobus ruber TaxID=1908690 RepID=A0A225DFB0_9BACT|nr:co-chaperone GroES [Fimbriiglobus ruber]OWK39673.1 Heat shock protein 60 family co-chaperone GroES [Fimbriiglobus ruber]
MDLKPIGDRIIVRRELSDEKTAGGILLPDAAKKKPQRGTILAVGPGKINKKDGTRAPMQLKNGDKVLFTSWAGDEFKDRKPAAAGDILIMNEDDVLAVIE